MKKKKKVIFIKLRSKLRKWYPGLTCLCKSSWNPFANSGTRLPAGLPARPPLPPSSASLRSVSPSLLFSLSLYFSLPSHVRAQHKENKKIFGNKILQVTYFEKVKSFVFCLDFVEMDNQSFAVEIWSSISSFFKIENWQWFYANFTVSSVLEQIVSCYRRIFCQVKKFTISVSFLLS